MRCWICGGVADTGEHAIKKSDLRILYENISQKDPVYKEIIGGTAAPIGSLKSPNFHLKSKICNCCNSALTQSHDKAWEALSKYLHANYSVDKKVLNFSSVFPSSPNKSMVYVQLYFLKIIGCLIKEMGMPIKTSGFSNSILNNVASSNLYLGFGFIHQKDKSDVAILKLQKYVKHDGIIHAANWYYIVGCVYVDIFYSSEREYSEVCENIWHPRSKKNHIKLVHFKGK